MMALGFLDSAALHRGYWCVERSYSFLLKAHPHWTYTQYLANIDFRQYLAIAPMK